MRRCASAAAVAGAAAMTSCAPVPLRPASALIFVEPDRQVVISHVVAEEREQTMLVRGRFARRTLARGKVWGHLHIEAWGDEGVLTSTDVNWGSVRHNRLPTYFRAMLSVSPEKVRQVRLSHAVVADRSRAVQEIHQ